MEEPFSILPILFTSSIEAILSNQKDRRKKLLLKGQLLSTVHPISFKRDM
ncbi:hypothetical protein RU99_GL000441 [Enterococcus casseliflavus]|nr:hypothetical protein RU99_GL000441 [Enterococcus casseliflavus]